MKAKKGFELREVCGEKVILATGLENVDFENLISVNDTAAMLWEKMQTAGEFTAEDMASWLCDAYEVGHDKALEDSEALCRQWIGDGLIEK